MTDLTNLTPVQQLPADELLAVGPGASDRRSLVARRAVSPYRRRPGRVSGLGSTSGCGSGRSRQPLTRPGCNRGRSITRSPCLESSAAPIPAIRCSLRSSGHRCAGSWASLRIGIEVSELSRPKPTSLDAGNQVGAPNPDGVSGCVQLAVRDELVESADGHSQVPSRRGRVEPLVCVVAGHCHSVSAGQVLHAPDQLAGIDFQGCGQPGNGVQARVPLAIFERADIRPGDSGTVGQRLLRQAQLVTLRPDPVAEEPLAGSRCLPGASHIPITEPRLIGVDAIGVTLSATQQEGWV